MSENLDLVRSLYADWERGDFSRDDWADPQIELVIVEGAQAGKWTGIAALAEAGRDWLDAWGKYRAEAQAFRELSNERVLVLARAYARSETSAAEVVDRSASVFDIHGGLVTRLAISNSRDRALADLGLEE